MNAINKDKRISTLSIFSSLMSKEGVKPDKIEDLFECASALTEKLFKAYPYETMQTNKGEVEDMGELKQPVNPKTPF